MRKKIAVITPVSHLPGIVELLYSKGEVHLLEKGNKQQVRDLILKEDIDTLVCNPNQQTFIIDQELLTGTKINIINSCSTGLNHIDVDFCSANNIEIQCHKNDYELINELPSTSELAFGLMLTLLRNINRGTEHVKNYSWDYTEFMGRQVKHLNIGIVGYGRLGKMMDKFCKAFQANTFIYDPYVKVPQTPLDEMFRICDVISLHVHKNPETLRLINKTLFGNNTNSPYIINTSRGEIVNEVDIVDGLKEGKIAGYGTDVIEDEFGTLSNSPIIKAMNKGQNIIITPHIGGMTIEGQRKAYKWSIDKL